MTEIETRDSVPITVESELRKQEEVTPPSSPRDQGTSSKRRMFKKGSNHRQEPYLNRRDGGTSYSPTTQSKTLSPFLGSVRKSIQGGIGGGAGAGGSSSILNTPFLVPMGSPASSLHSSYNSSSGSHPTLTYYSLDGHNMGGALTPPFMNPIRQHPPRISQIQKAMETAIVTERKRGKEMEIEEETMTAEQLRERLKQERHRMSKLAAELAKHKSMTVQCQLEAEVLEEGRINGLMRRLEELQLEKGRIIHELEREEEMLANTLQQKLDQVRKEKAELEKIVGNKTTTQSGGEVGHDEGK